ncbi:MAG: hypothetical protein ACI4RP_03680, partial [Acutalibacteraceae bacterium]
HQSPEGDSFPPRGSLNPLRVFFSEPLAATTNSLLFSLFSFLCEATLRNYYFQIFIFLFQFCTKMCIII